MNKLRRYNQKIDALDLKIVRLFEQRMCLVKSKAEYRAKHDLLPLPKRKRLHAKVVEKTTQTACDTEVIVYTEGLIQYMLTVAAHFYRHTIKRNKN